MMGQELRKARERAGLTQEQLSFRAGLSRPYISQLERDLKSPTMDTLFRICDALDVSAADVVAAGRCREEAEAGSMKARVWGKRTSGSWWSLVSPIPKSFCPRSLPMTRNAGLRPFARGRPVPPSLQDRLGRGVNAGSSPDERWQHYPLYVLGCRADFMPSPTEWVKSLGRCDGVDRFTGDRKVGREEAAGPS